MLNREIHFSKSTMKLYVKTCCACFSTRNGSLAVSVVYFFVSVLTAAVYAITLTVKIEKLPEFRGYPEYYSICLAYLVVYSCDSLMHLFLFFAIHRETKVGLCIFIFFSLIMNCAGVPLGYFNYRVGHSINTAVVSVVFVLLRMYFLVVIFSYYQDIRNKDKAANQSQRERQGSLTATESEDESTSDTTKSYRPPTR